jgi:hypothetical protein
MASERRRGTRHRRRLEVLLIVDGEAYQGTTRNISRGGAFVEVNLNIPVIVEPLVELRFFVPGPEGVAPVACKGRICWLEGVLPNGTGFGVQFEGLSQEQAAGLESYFTLDAQQAPALCRQHSELIGDALNRWVENGLVPRQCAETYRARVLG